MKKDGSADLRVVKTEEAIQKAFKEMICEMDYENLTVKELTERARINRKTFYLHYESLDELLLKLQEEIAANFIRREISYRSMEDIRSITRTFFRVRRLHADAQRAASVQRKLQQNGGQNQRHDYGTPG